MKKLAIRADWDKVIHYDEEGDFCQNQIANAD